MTSPPRKTTGNDPVILTCAITGNLTTVAQNRDLPVTPKQIAESALAAGAAGAAGAAVVHIHVRDPQTGSPSMELTYYREVIERIREVNEALILNLTTGPGGRYIPMVDDPARAAAGTTLICPERRVDHIAILKPDICTLDLNTMNSGSAVVINTPDNVRRMARVINDAGVKPEIELFDTGDIALLHDLIADGSVEPAPLCSLVMGVKYGLQPGAFTMVYASQMLPHGSLWTGFGIGRSAFPMVAQSVLAGGHARIGMEDTVYLDKGRLAKTNAELVVKARQIIELLGFALATPAQAREKLGL